MDYCEQFTGKKITVMGLGLLGRGIGDVRTLAKCGAELIVTDLKTKEQLASSLAELAEFPDITYVLGEHRIEDFRHRDMILKAAGVPLDSPYIAEARSHGIPIMMSATLFAQLSGIPIIAVTGTRGKSTVTHLIHYVLSRTTDGEILLGGNVRGVSNLALLEKVRKCSALSQEVVDDFDQREKSSYNLNSVCKTKEDSTAVLELDSWQLQGFGDAKIGPHIAVFTTFLDDHLNYYGGDREKYFADKAQIFLHQGSGDTFVTTPEVFDRAAAYVKSQGKGFVQEVVLADESSVPEDWTIPLPGVHNRRNVALARAALEAAGVADEQIWRHLMTFKALPGRLEFLGEHKGVKVYNDNNATTPDATIAALEAVGPEGKRVVLIAGGSEKNLDLDRLTKVIGATCKDVLLLEGTGTGRLHAALKEDGGVRVRGPYGSLREAVQEAFETVQEGDVLLFSPAFASFGMFQNEYQRNDQFVALIREQQL